MKDGINDYIVHGAAEAVNPERWAQKPLPTTSSNVGAEQARPCACASASPTSK